MSLLDVSTDGTQEVKLLDEGDEVQCRVVNVEEVPVKSRPGAKQLSVKLDIPAEPLVDDIFTYVGLPDEALKAADVKAYSKMVARWKTFCTCFGVDYGGAVDTDDFKGMTGDIIVGLEDDPTFGRRNRVKQYVTGA